MTCFFATAAPAFAKTRSCRPVPRQSRGRGCGRSFFLASPSCLGSAFTGSRGRFGRQENSSRGQETAPQPVGVATIGTGDIKVVVTALGTVTPIATVTVKTQVNGQLLEVAFKEGQTVKKGDFLAQIDPRPFQLAEAQFEGQLVHDQGLLDQAKMDLARYQTLVKQNSIARQQAEDQVFLVKQYEGSVKLDQAQIDNQKLNLIYAHIVSPVDGRIGLRLVDPGNYVQTTDPGLVVVAQMHPISVIFVVPEDDIPEIMAAIRAGRDARGHCLRPRQCHPTFGWQSRGAR